MLVEMDRGPAEGACAGMCVQVFLTPTHLAIAMEYAQGGDLFNYTLGHRPHGRLAEQQARWIFQQLIIGLDYSHRRVSSHSCVYLHCFMIISVEWKILHVLLLALTTPIAGTLHYVWGALLHLSLFPHILLGSKLCRVFHVITCY